MRTRRTARRHGRDARRAARGEVVRAPLGDKDEDRGHRGATRAERARAGEPRDVRAQGADSETRRVRRPRGRPVFETTSSVQEDDGPSDAAEPIQEDDSQTSSETVARRSTLDRVGEVLDEIDEEVEALEREQGRSRVSAIAMAEAASPPKTPPGDGEFELEGELAGLSDAQQAREACARAAEYLTERADDRLWWGHVRSGDLWGLEKMFRSGYTRVDDPEPDDGTPATRAGRIAVEVCARRGDAGMLELLLRYGADPKRKNAAGETALQGVWAFWGHDHASDRLTLKNPAARAKAAADERTTVQMMLMLLAAGADANASRADRQTVLHEAVRRGPVHAIRALLQYLRRADTSLTNRGAAAAGRHECWGVDIPWRHESPRPGRGHSVESRRRRGDVDLPWTFRGDASRAGGGDVPWRHESGRGRGRSVETRNGRTKETWRQTQRDDVFDNFGVSGCSRRRPLAVERNTRTHDVPPPQTGTERTTTRPTSIARRRYLWREIKFEQIGRRTPYSARRPRRGAGGTPNGRRSYGCWKRGPC